MSNRCIFALYQSAGLRIFDLANPFRPEEVAFLVPPKPRDWVDPGTEKARPP